MADVKKLITLEQLGTVKTYIDTNDAVSIKSGKFEDNTVKLYTTTDQSGTPAISLDLPEEMFLDQAKTVFVQNFAWSETEYPGSTDPGLDGKPVLVLAVKGDSTVNYSFISLDTMVTIYTSGTTNSATVTVGTDGTITSDVKISATADNAVVVNSDGIYVPSVDIDTSLTYATDAEVEAMFSTGA